MADHPDDPADQGHDPDHGTVIALLDRDLGDGELSPGFEAELRSVLDAAWATASRPGSTRSRRRLTSVAAGVVLVLGGIGIGLAAGRDVGPSDEPDLAPGDTISAPPTTATAPKLPEIDSRRALEEEARRLQEEARHEADRLRAEATRAAELVQLRELTVSGWLRDQSIVSCTVIGASPNNFDRRIEVDCGHADGVRVGMPVVTSAGLIGKVTIVATDTSVVMGITDPNFHTPVEVAGSDGRLDGRGGDRSPTATFVDALPSDAAIAIGDPVVTAGGADSLAPAGIPIGHVARILDHVGSTDVEVEVRAVTWPDGAADLVTVVLHAPEREVGA